MKKRSKLLNPRAAAWAQIQTQYQAAILTNTYRENHWRQYAIHQYHFVLVAYDDIKIDCDGFQLMFSLCCMKNSE